MGGAGGGGGGGGGGGVLGGRRGMQSGSRGSRRRRGPPRDPHATGARRRAALAGRKRRKRRRWRGWLWEDEDGFWVGFWGCPGWGRCGNGSGGVRADRTYLPAPTACLRSLLPASHSSPTPPRAPALGAGGWDAHCPSLLPLPMGRWFGDWGWGGSQRQAGTRHPEHPPPSSQRCWRRASLLQPAAAAMRGVLPQPPPAPPGQPQAPRPPLNRRL